MTVALRALIAPIMVSSGQLRIIHPGSLVREFAETKGIIYGTTATFGAPYYGERVLGRLLYGQSHGKLHCTAEDYTLPEPKPQENGEQEPVNVVLVRRGGCTFVTKVRVAEAKRAHAVVVVDTTATRTAEEIQHVVMADDAMGHKVKIPTVMISNRDGQKLIDALEQEPVVVELAWDIPRGEMVVADFWMSSGSRESSEFLVRFRDSACTLQHHLQFVPHYHVFALPPSANAGRLCVANGTDYCAPDPDGAGPVTGADVVEEDLRQLCIWNTTARVHQNGATYSQEFWDYVARFAERCSGDRFGHQCSAEILGQVGASSAEVDRCVQQHRTKFLSREIKNTAWSPQALRLNGWRYSGPLDPETVLQAVCSGYATPLRECEELISGYSSRAWWSANSFSLSVFVWTAATLVCCLVLLFYHYGRHMTSSVRKVLREEVTLEVQNQMADYAQMTDGQEGLLGSRPSLSF